MENKKLKTQLTSIANSSSAYSANTNANQQKMEKTIKSLSKQINDQHTQIVNITISEKSKNEEENVKTTIDKAVEVLDKLELEWEILIIDDGSKDKTAKILKSFAALARIWMLLKTTIRSCDWTPWYMAG